MSTTSFVLQGGLDLVSPAIALPQGRAIAALNYESEARGYSRIGGFERFDGRPSPSAGGDAATIAARRAAISKPPGQGPIRGVVIYERDIYCFRDSLSGAGQMFKSTADGWAAISFGLTLAFSAGTVEFNEGATLSGGTSAATAVIDRVVLQSGAWNGSAAGYLVVSGAIGTFVAEQGTDSQGGKGAISSPAPIKLAGGGHYDFTVHNFYGAARRRRLYFTSGVDTAYEFDGKALSPIRTGNQSGTQTEFTNVMTRDGSTVLTRAGDTPALRGETDKPTHIGVHSNHLFLGFDAGSLMHSGVGEPLDFRTTAGAGEMSFGAAPTGILSSVSTSLVIFGQSRVEYLQGTDSETFEMKPISDSSGAARWSAQVAGESPIYLDEGGLRNLTTTSAFGDWRMGTLSQLIEPLIRAKREASVPVVASITVKAKDQYRLFFADGTGIVLYLGREKPELMPFRLPSAIFCAYSSEVREGDGERTFVGSQDGHVYEMQKGPSFDGAPVPAYIRLAWNGLGSPNMEKRFHSARVETDNASSMSVGCRYHVDYNATENLAGELRSYAVASGSADLMAATLNYADVDWTLAAAGEINLDDLAGIGRNIALTFITEHTTEDPHTLTALTLNFSPRRQLR
ncbi:hypothetical protein ASG43_03315 [Aureimonas sp. Leaf454]|nr:hypothetical protein ASG43_03315 [Aureimonas sp. Leaf454]